MATFVLSRQARDRAQIIRYAVGIGAIALTACVAETTVGARLGFFGAVPDLCIAAVLCIAWYFGRELGAIGGIIIGFLAECFGNVGIMTLPVWYMLFGYFTGHFAHRMEKRFLFFLVFAGIAAPSRLLMSTVNGVLFEIQALPHRMPILLAEAASAATFSILFYYPIGLTARWMNGRKG